MGIEYEIRFEYPNQDALDSFLRSVARFDRIDAKFASYEFRDPGNPGPMPDASAKIELDGIYFCDHGGKGQEIRDDIVKRLRATFGEVTIAEL